MSNPVASSIRSLGSIETQPRRTIILARLRDAISSGELAPGTHLAEVDLSETLGVSRGTLREALRHLQQEGLLTSDARGRLSVRVVTESEIRDIFAVRYALESLALETLCAHSDRERVAKELSVALDAMREAEGDVLTQLDADLAFHERLCELSGNETLLQSWRSVMGLTRAAITAAGSRTALMNMAVDRHAPIVEFVREGDAASGREFLRAHMQDASDRILERMSHQH